MIWIIRSLDPDWDIELLCRSFWSVLACPYGKRMVLGIVHPEECTVAEICENEERVVASRETKQFLQVRGVDLTGMKCNEILVLNVEGDHWEGDVLNGKPCGWGVLYNKDNYIAYEGFRKDAMNVCYGRKYYADISKIEYEGEWYEGMRWGRGVQYDRNGNVAYDGEWIFDKPLETKLVISTGKELLHNHIKVLIVNDNCCNEEEWRDLDLMLFPDLRELRVGDNCFKSVESVRVVHFYELESVVIGKNSFTGSMDYAEPCCFILIDCPKLRELIIGENSFSDYGNCYIEGVNALERIDIDGGFSNPVSKLWLISIQEKR